MNKYHINSNKINYKHKILSKKKNQKLKFKIKKVRKNNKFKNIFINIQILKNLNEQNLILTYKKIFN